MLGDSELGARRKRSHPPERHFCSPESPGASHPDPRRFDHSCSGPADWRSSSRKPAVGSCENQMPTQPRHRKQLADLLASRPWRPSGRCRPRPRRRPSSGTSRTTPSGGRATQLRHADHEHRDTRKRVREGEVAQERKRQARPTRDVCRPPSETTTALKLGGIGRVVGSTEIRGCRRLSGFPVRAAPSRRGRRRGRARL